MNAPSQAVNKADQNKEKWIENYSRIGIAAKGAVYLLVGGITLAAALGQGGQKTDRTEVLKTIIEQPFGQILLGIISFGLLGYAVWRFIQAIKDPDDNGTDAKGLIKRIGMAVSGIVYAGLTYYSASMVLGNSSGSGSGGGGGGSSSKEFFINKLLEQPFGKWLVAIVGAIIIIKGIMQFYRGFSGKFKKDVEDAEVEEKVKKTYDTLGKIGYLSRGVVLGIIGYFFFVAAIQANPDAARGTEGVFSFLNNTGGPWLMGLIAFGLAGYGVFMFVKAKYRQMDPLG
ncbi:MAG: DUF1206 domain-containing protein [Candidatus Cyclobacteriaceae bacterium M3_2C_046]